MIMIFLGPPGSGKGTQAKSLAGQLGVPHISLGDLLRDEVKRGTEIGQQAKAHMAAGHLVPDELTIELAEKRISQSDCQKGFIFDGFPRSAAQADALDKMFAEKKLTLDRADDNAAAIRTRFEVYERSTRPLIEHYSKMGKLLEIDAARSIEAIGRDLAEIGRN